MLVGVNNLYLFINMGLSVNDFKAGRLLYRGRVGEKFYFGDTEIIKSGSGDFFRRKDYHILPLVGFFADIEIYDIRGELVLVYLANKNYTYVERVRVIESRTAESFTGFEPGKKYRLTNGEIWEQVGGPYAPNHLSSGNVKIINGEQMMVDNWSFFPKVRLVYEF